MKTKFSGISNKVCWLILLNLLSVVIALWVGTTFELFGTPLTSWNLNSDEINALIVLGVSYAVVMVYSFYTLAYIDRIEDETRGRIMTREKVRQIVTTSFYKNVNPSFDSRVLCEMIADSVFDAYFKEVTPGASDVNVKSMDDTIIF